jgi:hypothetical protein
MYKKTGREMHISLYILCYVNFTTVLLLIKENRFNKRQWKSYQAQETKYVRQTNETENKVQEQS